MDTFFCADSGGDFLDVSVHDAGLVLPVEVKAQPDAEMANGFVVSFRREGEVSLGPQYRIFFFFQGCAIRVASGNVGFGGGDVEPLVQEEFAGPFIHRSDFIEGAGEDDGVIAVSD